MTQIIFRGKYLLIMIDEFIQLNLSLLRAVINANIMEFP
ncbi:hypothetical protein RINTHM_3700 [Richelia intracellularis HM01]|nr:hypothetical protein RINTHM_3700 [Richelia intracellularis HM01]